MAGLVATLLEERVVPAGLADVAAAMPIARLSAFVTHLRDRSLSISVRRLHGRVHTGVATRVAISGNILVLVSLLLMAVLFCLPALINASGVHADAATVGLQAEHILRGEWSWFIWGTDYQGAI